MDSEDPVVVSTAGHVGDAFADTIELCRDAIARDDAIGHLTHYSLGMHNFSVDRPDAAHQWRHDDLVTLGRRLSFQFTVLDRTVHEARTGSLIRLVAQTAEGAVICVTAQPGDQLVGIVRAPMDAEVLPRTPRVRQADALLSMLAVELRAQTRLSSQNPGGFETLQDFVPIIGEVTDPKVTVRRPGAPGADRVAELAAEALRHKYLHFVTYFVDGEVAVTADSLGEPELSSFFTQIHVDLRRRFYVALARQLPESVTRLNRLLSPIPGGRLLRLVLDVEQGAIYYYRLGAGRYLVSITLDQSSVIHGDEGTADLATQVLRYG
ncbi:hypothetical protein SAMN04488564_101169 [Lentzea waywayandensis]|uniref:Uncharacterized protein n=1 Tax=Lentzea waywayandensis TaxID=84724 RepID=A0A1I6CS43_9PSEU|nr:hypothetical protein [Lentzea waywayandensis]SFQ95903.1 hypothetical protein SAMN04488564_101169 [Lentzea waywayandensis]